MKNSRKGLVPNAVLWSNAAILSFTLASCGSETPPTPVQNPAQSETQTPEEEHKAKKDDNGIRRRPASPAPTVASRLDSVQLSNYVLSVVEQEDLTDDFYDRVDSYCPKYDNLPKRIRNEFIAAFVTAISGAETNFNSFTGYRESWGDMSLGLFQTSYVDRGIYGCEYDQRIDRTRNRSEKSIYQTRNQVTCATKIIRRLMQRPSNFPYLRNLARRNGVSASDLSAKQRLGAYWSIFRSSNTSGQRRFQSHLSRLAPNECN